MSQRGGAAAGAIRWGLVLLLLVLALAALLQNVLSRHALEEAAEGKGKTPPAQPQQIAKTTIWMNVYSPSSLLDEEPLPLGAVIQAYDAQGIPCGEFVVAHAGKFGLMPIYGDDPSTRLDEGALPGDAITFRVNGSEAASTPAKIRWTTYGDVQRVDLYAYSPGSEIQGWFAATVYKLGSSFERHVTR